MSKRGYKTADTTFTVAAGERRTIRLTLEENYIQIPRICLYSKPSGASVILDGTYIGKTPLENYPMPQGKHSVQYTLEGYEQVLSSITADFGRVSSLSLTMPAKKNNDPRCNFISSPSGASVTVDGVSIGTTPLNGYYLRPGAHKIRYSLSGYKDSLTSYNAVYDSYGDIYMELVPLSAA